MSNTKTKEVPPRRLHRMVRAQMLYEAEKLACKKAAACDPDFCACSGHTEWKHVSPPMKRYYALAAQYFLRSND